MKSIKTKLLISHLAIFLLVILMGFFITHQVREQMLESARNRMNMVAAHMAKMVVYETEQVKKLILRMADGREVEDYSENFRRLALARYLSKFKNAFTSVSYVTADGFEEVRVVKGKLVESSIDFSNNPYFTRAKEQPNRFFVDFQSRYLAGNSPTITFYYGLKRYFGDEFVGMIVATYPLSSFTPVLRMMELGEEAIMCLINANGLVLASNNSKYVNTWIFDQETFEGFDTFREYGKRNFEIGDLHRRKSFFSYEQIEGENLFIVAAFPYENFIKGPNKLRNYYFLTLLLSTIIGIAIAFKLSNLLTSPLLALNRAAMAISRGEPQKIKGIASEDEIGQLVVSFNRMVENLETTTISKNYLYSIIHSIQDSIMVVAPDDSVVTVNVATSKMTGYELSDILNNPVGDLLGPVPEDFDCWFEYLNVHSFSKPAEREYLRKDRTSIPVLFTLAKLHDEKDNVTGIICVAHDISERKMAERKLLQYAEKLKESNTELEEFAYVASHDLQEPLRKVLGFGERLKMKYGDQLGDVGRDYLERMENASIRMQSLIRELLTYSRVKTQARPFEPIDLNEIVAGVISDLETRIEETGTSIQIGSLPTIEADPLQMRQLLQNIIGNAMKFVDVEKNPQIDITARIFENDPRADGGRMCEILIRDNGIGFDTKYADRIFGVFQRLHGRGEYEGSGVGLAICKKIVKRHSGDIIAESTLGDGAVFKIQLPVHQKKQIDEEI